MSLILLSDITKTYSLGQTQVEVLKGIGFNVEHGEYVSLLGQSGCGKSTLMHIIGCLDTPTSGTYNLIGKDVARLSDNELSHIRNKYIGFVFQSFHLLPRASVLANVEMPLLYAGVETSQRRKKAKELLEKVNLSHRITHYPGQLSGGERQRVCIARALVNDPKLILADEPTGNLDSEAEEEILSIFKQLNEDLQVTIIMVTHNPSIALRTNRSINLKDGRLEDA